MLLDTVIRGFENRIWLPKNMCANLNIERNSKVRMLMLDVPNAETFVFSNHSTPLRAIRQELLLIIEAIDQKLKAIEIMQDSYKRAATMTEEEWLVVKEKVRMRERTGE